MTITEAVGQNNVDREIETRRQPQPSEVRQLISDANQCGRTAVTCKPGGAATKTGLTRSAVMGLLTMTVRSM